MFSDSSCRNVLSDLVEPSGQRLFELMSDISDAVSAFVSGSETPSVSSGRVYMHVRIYVVLYQFRIVDYAVCNRYGLVITAMNDECGRGFP